MESKSTSGGIGFFGLLTIVFITLKLTHYIDWSWWLVLSPILVPIVLLITVILFFTVAILVFGNKIGVTFKNRK